MPDFTLNCVGTVDVYATLTITAENKKTAEAEAERLNECGEINWQNANGFDMSNAARHIDNFTIDDIVTSGGPLDDEDRRQIERNTQANAERTYGEGAGGSQVRYTFAVGQMGPSSDGDGGSYYLTSIERPDPGLSDTEERGWAEGQLLEELEEQGDHLGESVAFVVYMGKEDVLEDAPEDEDAPEEAVASADFHCDVCGNEITKGSDYLASLTKKFCGEDCAQESA